MEKQLENLRKALDETLLKNAEFTISSKQAVLHTLRKKPKPLSAHFVKQSASLLVTAALFASVLLFAVTKVQHDPLQSESNSIEKTENPNQTAHINTVEDNREIDARNSLHDTAEKSIPASYVVFDNYYYEKTSDSVEKDKLIEKVGEVKRIGNWKIVKDGDSNEIPPGPLYTVKDFSANEYVAGKGVVFENGVNKEGYLLFKRSVPVSKPETSKIFSAKGDAEEVHIAIQNIRRAAEGFYELRRTDVTPTLVSYSDQHGQAVMIYYMLENKKDEFVFVSLFKNSTKNSEYPASRFSAGDLSQDFKEPEAIGDYIINDIKWVQFRDFNRGDTFYAGYGTQWNLEVSFQGKFNKGDIDTILGDFK